MHPKSPQYHAAGTRSSRAHLVAILCALLAAPNIVAAQAILRGRVVDAELGNPLSGATVRIKGVASPLTTDSAGRFVAPNLKAEMVEITIQVMGYARGTFQVPIPAAGEVSQTFGLDFTGANLPEIVVQARVNQLMPRYAEFEARRQHGMGAYLRWDDLLKKGSNSVGDALRTVRGVRIQCDQARYECYVAMARSLNCRPTWWIDGVQARSFNESTSIRDIYGIEIYRGPGEVPGEYGGSDAACGVIVMWTKSRPFR